MSFFEELVKKNMVTCSAAPAPYPTSQLGQPAGDGWRISVTKIICTFMSHHNQLKFHVDCSTLENLL